ncbi:MAG: hypothetical protein IPG86_13180 [Chitinophagaceae bacterium]|nr:hypothetical protein [Chitinophagaceae bacterium]
MRYILISILFLLPVLSRAQQPSPEAEQFFSMAMSQINSKHVGWIKRTAADTNYNNLNQQVLGRKAKAYAGIYSITGEADIQALVFLVLMQASKSANEDIRAIMEKVKSDNEKKKKLREAQEIIKNNQQISAAQYDSFNLVLVKPAIKQNVVVNQNNASVNQRTVSRQDINTLAEKLGRELDSMNEMSEMNSIRLQIYMDRVSKMQSTISNIMKKIDSTKNQIVQNLK